MCGRTSVARLFTIELSDLCELCSELSFDSSMPQNRLGPSLSLVPLFFFSLSQFIVESTLHANTHPPTLSTQNATAAVDGAMHKMCARHALRATLAREMRKTAKPQQPPTLPSPRLCNADICIYYIQQSLSSSSMQWLYSNYIVYIVFICLSRSVLVLVLWRYSRIYNAQFCVVFAQGLAKWNSAFNSFG